MSLLDSGLFVCDFTNVQRGSLAVEKRVTGIGDPEKEFTFTVKLAGSSTAGIPAEDIDGLYGGMTFELPKKWVKIAPPRVLSEAQKKVLEDMNRRNQERRQ